MKVNSAGPGTGAYWLAASAGAAIALVAAGVYFSARQVAELSEEDTVAIVSRSAPVVVQNTELPEPSPQNLPAEQAAMAPEAVAEPSEQPQAATVAAPSIDEVRVDRSGMLVVAGRAEPGAKVDVLVDGEVVVSVDADGSGSFAALSSLAASDDARRLTLRTGDGAEALASNEEIILAPVPVVPAVVAPRTAAVATRGDTMLEEVPTTQSAPSEEQDVAATDLSPAPAPETPDAQTAAAVTPREETEVPEPATDKVAEAEPNTEVEAAAGTQIAVLRSDEEGVTLVSPQPSAQSVVLDTIGYTEEGDVQLAGRAEPATVEVRAYLDNRAVAQLSVDEDGNWRGEVPEVETGVYTLRVDALDADGDVVSRVETPFKREAPAVLAAAAAAAGPDRPVRSITVQTGDTLWAIARGRYGDGILYLQVYDANRSKIIDPDLIYPGQVFDLPVE